MHGVMVLELKLTLLLLTFSANAGYTKFFDEDEMHIYSGNHTHTTGKEKACKEGSR